MNDQDIGRLIVLAGCVYESVAIVTRRVPTITALSHRGIDHVRWRWKLAAWVFAGGIGFHLIGLDRRLRPR